MRLVRLTPEHDLSHVMILKILYNKVTFRHIFYVAIYLVLMILTSCENDKGIQPGPTDLISQATKEWHLANYQACDSIGRLIEQYGKESGDDLLQAKGLYYQSGYAEDVTDSEAERKIAGLQKALQLMRVNENHPLLANIYNQLGVWQLMHRRGFYTSQYYFGQAITAASNAKDRKIGIPAEMNLSEIFRITGDRLGLQHDLNLLEYAVKSGDKNLMFSAGYHCALYQTSQVTDTAQLRPYIDAMRGNENFDGIVNMIYARFFYDKRRYEEAEKYILNADTALYIDSKILYGDIESKLGNYSLSNKALMEAIDQLENQYPESVIYKIHLYRLISSNFHEMGDNARAWANLNVLDRLRTEADSLANLDKLDRYKVEYDVMRFGYELDAERLKGSRLRIMLILIVAAMIIGGVAAMLYIKKRNRLYREIVARSIEAQRLREDTLPPGPSKIMGDTANEGNDEIKNNETEDDQEAKKAYRSSLTADKSAEIFAEVRRLMEVEKVWKDKDINRDRLAEKVGCNRTYLWEVIRQHTGMGFTQYLTTCRINEAMRELSDTGNDIELKRLADKLGFQSLSTFYAAFKKQAGLSPANYRRTAREIMSKSKTKNIDEED
ncbi:MAG: helix-turn-helix domain-containing protein [Muribaculum sp.]|nr:helix-turn-helix domain-containing protein [Muribaculum sp.]MCM1141348.1 helix-turn-helix domain-containing protein [Muribaculum sp.]